FIIGAMVAFILFNAQSKRVIKKFKNPNSVSKVFIKFAILDLIIALIIMAIFSYLIPLGIWTFGEKEILPTEKVIFETEVSAFSGETYLKTKKVDDNELYYVNTGKDGKIEERIVNKNNVDIIEATRIDGAKYKEVLIYDFKRLKGSSIVHKLVNDMFANIYIQDSEATFKEKRTVISLPKGYKVEEY
ncbi:hypothetical protein, partial [Clostridium sp.]|uniref:hypothetical protein n=1 Tax=Clostridium sp. TaxID=1506 RepID=UPI0034648BB0